ncbi:hypothetical protein [Microbacterium lushaniae]|uniref:Uncharacterized protein n=1 Tax=Microbacterium lushaniae TaxID=2614639 RepID=A0A5J6L394_9MICO|nr:hypothetical protein [Microbacterium lushaniae]QEW03029.1 hypothetical protein F6J85_07885 [Microbacterium lushaniae]
MNDLDFESRVRNAAPNTATPIGLADHSGRILREARARRTRQVRLWAASAAASVVLVGAGTVAVAGNGLQTPWGWTADNVYQIPGPDGETCFAGLVVKPDGVADDAPVVQEAHEIVAALDLDALDTSAAAAELIVANDQPFADGSPGVAHYTDEEIAQSAMHQTVAKILFAELEDRGLSTSKEAGSVSLLSQAQGCQ